MGEAVRNRRLTVNQLRPNWAQVLFQQDAQRLKNLHEHEAPRHCPRLVLLVSRGGRIQIKGRALLPFLLPAPLQRRPEPALSCLSKPVALGNKRSERSCRVLVLLVT